MPNPGIQIQVGRDALAQVFKDPRTLLAFEKLLQTVNTPTIVAGDIKAAAGTASQDGWLVCDGTAVGRTVYPDLFSAIGTTWGPGDGSTTFNLPDLRGRTLFGASAGMAVGSTGGASSTVLTIAQLPAHNHGVNDPGHTHAVNDPGHTHTVNDPQHNHGISDPGHVHAITDPGHVHPSVVTNATSNISAGTTAESTIPGDTGNAVTDITINSADTGVTVNSNATGITNHSAETGVTNVSAETGVTTENTGGGAAVATMPPYAVITWLIKT